MIELKNDTLIPEWLKNNIPLTCPYCGCDLVSNHDTGVITELWCSNPICPEHLAYRMVYVAKYYGLKGFGPATCRDIIEMRGYTSHLEVLPTWFDNKPEETLSRIVDLACIRDVGITSIQADVDKFASMEDFFTSTVSSNYPKLVQNKEYLIDAQKYFTVKKPVVGKVIRVMATGNIEGYPNRDDFFTALNNRVGDKIHIIQTGVRKTGVLCLIKDPGTVDHTKSRVAKDCGIPIVTSKQFTATIFDVYKSLGGNLCQEVEATKP